MDGMNIIWRSIRVWEDVFTPSGEVCTRYGKLSPICSRLLKQRKMNPLQVMANLDGYSKGDVHDIGKNIVGVVCSAITMGD